MLYDTVVCAETKDELGRKTRGASMNITSKDGMNAT